MEHHSNLIPWQMVCRDRGTVLRAVPVLAEGYLDLEAYGRLLSPRTRVVALAHVSNVLGTINPVAQMVEQAHRVGALVLLDGAQAVPHLPLDVTAHRRGLLRVLRPQDARPDRHRSAATAAARSSSASSPRGAGAR